MTQFSNLRALLLFVTLLFLFPLKGMAGPQYVDKSDFAVSGYDVVAYRSLESKSVGETQTEAIPGRFRYHGRMERCKMGLFYCRKSG